MDYWSKWKETAKQESSPGEGIMEKLIDTRGDLGKGVGNGG